MSEIRTEAERPADPRAGTIMPPLTERERQRIADHFRERYTHKSHRDLWAVFVVAGVALILLATCIGVSR